MYQIYCDNELLYDPRDETLAIIEGKVSLETNKTGELRFALPICHPFAGRIKKLTSVLRVLIDEEELFCGRLLDVDTDMYGTGTYTCEGEMAYLLDSIQRPKEYHDLTPRNYLQDKLAQHNSQVEESKKFALGLVEKASMNYDARQDNQYASTLSTIMDKLVSSNGGYLRVRKEEGIRYLDYLESYGRTSGQIIRFGENILDLTEHLSASDIITVLIPLGKAPDGAKEGEKLTIASVNDGKDYLENAEAIALYGRIVGANEWQDVTVPANLKAKGQEYLIRMRNLATTIELTAIDLHLADVDIDQIRLGDMIRAVSKPHGLDRYMLVSKREYDLLEPEEDKIVLGDTISTLTEKQAALQKSVEQQKDAAASVEKLKASVQTVEKDIDSTKQAVTAIDGKVQVLETSATETQKRLQEIQNTMTGISQTLEGLSVQDEAFQAILDDILARLESLEGGRNKLTLEEKIRQEIARFREAIYGEDVRDSYADIAETVCVEAMRALDHAVEQGNAAEVQGNYAKTQGDYANDRGNYAEKQADSAVEKMSTDMNRIQAEFNDIKDVITSMENGELLLRVEKLLDDMYRMATEYDIDNIISGTYADEDEQGSIFETGTDQDIDEIIGGSYVDNPDEGGSVTEDEIQNMVDGLFK